RDEAFVFLSGQRGEQPVFNPLIKSYKSSHR
ncbi:MAG: hypothetical protein QOD00_1607, partial [Blastocatellia bacterium]|nr:hypothetical protein [Blastocatellia bacterium]